MLVRERMSKPVITIPPQTTVPEALNLMKQEHIRRLPVVEHGKLVGYVTDKHLLSASPSPATSLSVWEITYLLSKLAVDRIMSRQVITTSEDTPLEEAARIMVDNKIGGLPVLRGEQLVGIITESDLMKTFLEFMGARERGIRLTLLVKEEKGGLAQLARTIAGLGGNIVAMGLFMGEDPGSRVATVKVAEVNREALLAAVRPLALKVIDVRDS
ncbi:MAG: CBS domain-containing protein [Anaerolineales bacterium]|jgi:acetoin utilization protein AcuB